MPIVKRLTLAALVLTWLASPLSLAASDSNRAEGQLLRVDASARKIVIRTEQGAQLQCTFTGNTRVVGATANIAAVPPLTRLTVHYSREEMEFLATEIEVHNLPF